MKILKKPLVLVGIGLALVYSILAFKDPYSERSLVPNLEPFPDTLFYSNPAWNFVHGNGFSMVFQGVKIDTATPPLYSLFLIPFFLIFGDVRSFYFANISLGVLSLGLFFLISQKLFKSWLSILIAGVFYVTSFYLFQLPGLLMAENATLFLTLVSAWLLVQKPSSLKVSIAAVIGVLLLLVKLSNAPLGAVFYTLYGIKLLKYSRRLKVIFGLLSFFALVVFCLFIWKSNILSGMGVLESDSVFSWSNVAENAEFYLRSLAGGETRYLWFSQRLISTLITVLAVGGIVWGLMRKELRWQSSSFLALIIGLVGFMSFFYYPDARYILAILPLIFLFSGIAMDVIFNCFKGYVEIVTAIVITSAYFLVPRFGYITGKMLAISLKEQAAINVKFAERPWNYLAVDHFNSFFSSIEDRNSYIGTFLPPFYVDMFQVGNYSYLPISPSQEFSSGKRDLFGRLYSGDIHSQYISLLQSGSSVYVSPYYVSNMSSWHKDWQYLEQTFQMDQVSEGCMGACSIYRLSLKTE